MRRSGWLAREAAIGAWREIQSLCASVWMVANQKYTVQGRCGDQQQYVVTHTYTQQVATIHGEKFDALRSEMCAHLEFATGTLASALFGHARAEHQLFGFLQSRVLALELEPPLLLDLLRAVASRLDGNDGGAGGETLDARSLPVLRKLALTLGSQLRAGALTTGGGGVTELHATLLSLLFRGRGCAWAAPLLQPPASELGTNRWLWHLLVNAPAESGSLAAAADLEAFVAQLDWSELATLPPKDVDAYVIQPIQRALRRYDESEQPAAVTLLASLLAAAARAQPSLTQPALTVLTRSTVRAALAAAPTLALWPWASLAPEVLWACWCELYRVPATRIDDYEAPARLSARPPIRPPAGPPAPPPHPPPPSGASQARHPLQCHAQQKEFMRFQLAHPTAAAECYGRHAPLASVNDLVSFPMLSLLRRIALHAAYPESGDGDGRLTTIAARELFALAVMLDAPTDAARVFQLEASANLSALCKRLPALVAAVVDEAASRVPQLVGNGVPRRASSRSLLRSRSPTPPSTPRCSGPSLNCSASAPPPPPEAPRSATAASAAPSPPSRPRASPTPLPPPPPRRQPVRTADCWLSRSTRGSAAAAAGRAIRRAASAHRRVHCARRSGVRSSRE